MNSWSKGNLKLYSMVSLYRRQNTDSLDATVNQDAEYLVECFCKSVGYSKVDTASSI